MKKPMPISTKSVSTTARQVLRKMRRINRIAVRMARKLGMLEHLATPASKRVDARVVKVCRRQRRKFMPMVLDARA